MHGRNHRPKGWYGEDDPGGSDPLNWLTREALTSGPRPSYAGVIAGMSDLRGYWRLGDGPEPYADTSGFDPTTADLSHFGSGTALDDLATGVLPAPHDDGCVRFNGGVALQTPSGLSSRFAFGQGAPYTATAWARPKAGSGAGTIYLANTGASNLDGWRLGFTAGRAVEFTRHANNVPQTITTSFSVPEEQWVFIAAVDAVTTMLLYIDGALVHSQAATNHGAAAAPLVIGAAGNGLGGAGNGALNASLDELAIFHAALTANQIFTLYEAGRVDVAIPTVYGAWTFPRGVSLAQANGTFTVTLETAVGFAGAQHTLKNIGTGTVTLTGSETIDGAGSYVLASQHDAVTVYSDGAVWRVLSSHP
jgi:hypothetical protein